jgi:signal transduction histidine kinase
MEGSLTKSELLVPIKVKGRTVGVLDVQSEHEDDFERTDLELMQAIANQTGIAIENARLFAETQHLLEVTKQRANELAIISSVQQELASKLDAQSIYELLGDTFRNFFNAQVVMISAYDPQSNTVEHRYAIERGERVDAPGKLPPGGFRDQIIRTKQPVLINRNVADEAVRLEQPIIPGTGTPRSWLGVPMLLGDQVTGILSVQNLDEENAFGESEMRLLQTFASAMSIALENARLYEQARQLAILDERQRLARELHDSVTQSLYGISLYAQAATGNIHAKQIEQATQYLEDIQNTAQESLADMRLLIYELRPPVLEKEGLVSALQQRLNSVEDRARIKSSIQTNLSGRLPAQVEECLYQIAREALNNVIKHARARTVAIHIRQEAGSVSMEIADDGVGFDPVTSRSQGSLGLANMQERAQSQGWALDIASSLGNGTRIKVETGEP